jgi:hypothetical protein
MRVTIIRKPEGAVSGMWLGTLQMGQTYNLRPDVASALVVKGFGIAERRWGDRRKTPRDESHGRRADD